MNKLVALLTLVILVTAAGCGAAATPATQSSRGDRGVAPQAGAPVQPADLDRSTSQETSLNLPSALLRNSVARLR